MARKHGAVVRQGGLRVDTASVEDLGKPHWSCVSVTMFWFVCGQFSFEM